MPLQPGFARLERDDFSSNRHPALSFCLSMISAQTLRVCREGKPVPTFPDHALGHKLAAEFVLDVNLDDVVKRLFGGGEAELERPLGVEIARPAVDNTHDERVGLAFDPPRHLVA